MKCPYCNKRSIYAVDQADDFNWLCLNCGQLFSTKEEKTLVLFSKGQNSEKTDVSEERDSEGLTSKAFE